MGVTNKSFAFAAVALAVMLSACSGPKPEEGDVEVKVLSLMSADLVKVAQSELSQGPMISGSLQPVTKAELNAEVSGIVTKIMKDNGDSVKAGELLVQLDQTTYRDKLMSAQESERSASVTADQAQKQLRRMQQLNKQNLVTAEILEAAEIKANQASSDLASAKARLVEARQQLERTEVRAPFSGVISARKTSAGDTAQIGKALMVVIDPSSMRFEGFIAADQVGSVKVGQTVNFKVNGYPNQRFTGTINRINPQANELTRQVQVFVELSKQDSLVAGLYAEGFIDVASQQSVMLDASSIVREGDNTFVWTVANNRLTKTPVTLGARDPRFGTYQVIAGVKVGDDILRHPVGGVKDGIAITLAAETEKQAPVAGN
ncbi:MAG: efflux RND transporter periplasmic adaptor subunit [Gammaproteobacteria bacterium]|jgi:RND family efflux transporter MFP subunit|nr:efflux RND transporter periplasmic adaptor subunit [Gammaproteobacteria bacterium]